MGTKTGNSRREFLRNAGFGAAALGASACGGRGQQPSEAGPSVLHRSAVREAWSTDVLVVGGGPAGIGAAIGAARQGVEVLVIENHGFFGGVGAWALGMPINQVRPKGKPRSAVHELLVSKVQAYGPRAVTMGDHQLWCNVDYLKVAVADAFEEAGVKYYLHVRAVDAVVEGNRITGVVAGTKAGLVLIKAKVVIDCTGDADVAQYAGAETLKETGKLSPMTLLLKVTNVDPLRAKKVKLGDVANRARTKYPLIPKTWNFEENDPSSNSFYINHSCTRDFENYDGSDPLSFTRAEVFARRQALQMTEAMREYGGPDLASLELIGTSPQICVRETRRVKGVYVLTEEDAVQGRTFDDVVAWRSGFLDVGFVKLSDMKIHDVPYRAIVPEKLDGLLVGGRCISATHDAASAGKSMGNCMATGHAAAVAASLCVKKKILPRDVEVKAIQDALRAEGVDFTMGGQDQKGLVLKG